MNPILGKTKSLLNRVYANIEIILCRLLYHWYVYKFRRSPKNQCRRLHVGCGRNRFDNWINSDITLTSDLIIFLQKRLPFYENELDLIYSEHVLEHVSFTTGISFLKETRRVLRPREFCASPCLTWTILWRAIKTTGVARIG